jgi:hypothetical protein
MARANLDKLRKRLKREMNDMSQGLFIRMKGFKRGLYRLLPIKAGELPGKQVVEYYSPSVGERGGGTVSPETWGDPDPVADLLTEMRREASKEEKEELRNLITQSTRYYLAVLDMANLGDDPTKPNIRIFPARKTVYMALCEFIIGDEDLGDDPDDISDPVTGRNFIVRKYGSGLDTEYSVKFQDPSPIVDDEEALQAIVEACEAFDLEGNLRKPDWDVLQDLYSLLSHEPIPEDYLPEERRSGKASKKRKKGLASNSAKQKARTKRKAQEEEEPEEDEGAEEVETDFPDKGRVPDEGEEPETDEDYEEEAEDEGTSGEIVIGETLVEFVDEDEEDEPTYRGRIVGEGEDEDGDIFYDVEVDGFEDTWGLYEGSFKIVEPPKEVKPKRKKSKRKKGSVPKKPASSKIKKKAK